MIFNSLEFPIFFGIVFALYWFVLNKNRNVQNILLIAASYVFYGWWDWRFLSLIILSSILDYSVGFRLGKTNDKRRRKQLLYLSLFVNLGLLGVMKYFNFFIDSFTGLLSDLGVSTNTYTLNIILPVGISFYTFQTLSYTVDVYKRKMEPVDDIVSFFAFVSFFPQLVAGPIERAKHLLPQFQVSRKFDYALASSGAQLILRGFFKKVVIADGLAVLVDTVYNNPADYTGFPMVVATIFFAFQIYCDFSGYSDIAIGTSRLLGFDLMKNFNTPYFSKSLTEFWRRWHISLSSWFRDYVYIPLGGSRATKKRASFNILVTFVVSGLWHGANWTFVIWGAIHGCILLIEKQITGLNDNLKTKLHSVYSYVSIPITFIIVSFAWIFFRSNSVSDAVFIIRNMFSDVADYQNFEILSMKFRGMGLKMNDLVTSLVFLSFLLMIEYLDNKTDKEHLFGEKPVLKWAFNYVLLVSIVFWGTQNSAGNFIYFQF